MKKSQNLTHPRPSKPINMLANRLQSAACKIVRILIFFALIIFSPMSVAGFFSMPDITETPQFERKSLLKDLDIPGVKDRDPDPDAGPRLNISRFRLEGIVEFPELGISKKDIEELIEGIRFDLMQEFDVQESGFTEAELEELSNLLVEIEEETLDRHVSELEVQRLIWLVREQRSKRGVTLGQIETVADRITQFYRQRGFILAKAYIPQQEVRDGVVTLTLLLGTLGEVRAENNQLYDDDILLEVFEDWYLKPVTKDSVEENLYLINDFPGVIANGFFEPGDQVGDTRLILNTRLEEPQEFNVRLDNHGSQQTGEYRWYGEAKFNNLFGNADQLHLAGLYTVDPDNNEYLQVRYSSRIFSPRLDLAIGFSNNDFILGSGNSESESNIDALELSGSTSQADISANYRIKRSRTNSYYGTLKLERIESELNVGAFPDSSIDLDDVVRNTVVGFRYDILDEANAILHQGEINWSFGDFTKGAEVGQDEDYWIISTDYTLLTFWQPSFMDKNTRLVFRSSLQFTDSALSSINQYSLAGPTKVRAYQSNQFSADRGVYAGLDWVMNFPDSFDWEIADSRFNNVFKPFVFIDTSWGESQSLVNNVKDSTGQLTGGGIGVQMSYSNVFQGNLQIAFPFAEDFSSDDIVVSNDDYKIIMDLQYSFR